MNRRDWKSGDVAQITYVDGESDRALRTSHGDWSVPGGFIPGERDAQPLIVLDLSPHDVYRAVQALRESRGMVAMEVADKLEAAAKVLEPPRPEEPQGLGAVVEDADGVRWVRTCSDPYPWGTSGRDESGDRYTDACTYANIAVVRILAEGWSE